MNDAALIGMAVISTLGMLAGIQLMNHNWFKREKVKYQYQMKRAKLKAKGLTVKKGAPTGALGWIDTLKSLDPEILHTLIDQFGGEIPEEEGDLTDILGNIIKSNPDLVKSFIEGLGKGKQDDGVIYNK